METLMLFYFLQSVPLPVLVKNKYEVGDSFSFIALRQVRFGYINSLQVSDLQGQGPPKGFAIGKKYLFLIYFKKEGRNEN